MSFITTHSGHSVHMASPTPRMIDPVDIGRSLSRICRFGGHTRQHYSVAQHCVLASQFVPAEHQLTALMHDATEAYIGDMVSPLKALMPEFKRIEGRFWAAIAERFGLPGAMDPCIKKIEAWPKVFRIPCDSLVPNSRAEENAAEPLASFFARSWPRGPDDDLAASSPAASRAWKSFRALSFQSQFLRPMRASIRVGWIWFYSSAFPVPGQFGPLVSQLLMLTYVLLQSLIDTGLPSRPLILEVLYHLG